MYIYTVYLYRYIQTMESTLIDIFREAIGLGSQNNITMGMVMTWDPNKAIKIGEWSVCGGGQLEMFYYT